ncbi:YceI family protein [Microbacterium sp. ARD32]|uniref:YceI family protein n=1 Tax=Microbacterium sp. ARD32 TaxID=2962577 RepID=UPI002881898A|nr:YceI family protein [Microbacterium sp. ARD32]MDT0156081.1 YceI family protein [Microbacterium sp. ARD32]
MKKRTLVTLAIAGVAVVGLGVGAAVAGPIIYRDYFVEPAASAPALQTAEDTAAGEAVDVADLQGEWTVGDDSYAGYRVDEVLNGTDVTVTGRTEKVTGALTVSDDALTAARIEVDVASIATDSGNRDAYFRNDAMRASESPTATFELTEPVQAGSALQQGVAQTVTATGDLTLAGVTQPVSVELQAVLNGESGQVVGSIPITFADFGVEAPSLGFVSVEDDGFVEFSLQLVRG